ncbi:MAG TPA: hypothetical protein PLL64_05845 [Rhodothermales bacterium]|nr:hypothetical protein [Bacteroidota bacterium]HRK73777.1 hypothetical protein [Rhodothermales bacterium]HRR09269.1 hypothetical protein [Rhodothermales bacterium]
MKLVTIALVSLVVHLSLGWMYAPLVSLVGGYWQGRGGGRLGAVALALSWLGLMIWNYMMAPSAMQKMFSMMSGILGNLPSFGFPVITLLFALLLGALSGYIGAQGALVLKKKPRQ